MNRRGAVDLGRPAGQLPVQQGQEWIKATCETCGASWEGWGTQQARLKLKHAQGHADHHGHLVSVQHANRR